MRTLTLAKLVEKSACIVQRDLFRRHFGDSVKITQDTVKSVASDFNWKWAAENLLSVEGYKAYRNRQTRISKAYNKVYNAAIIEIRKVYDDATAEARKTYRAAVAGAGEDYDAVNNIAGKIYEKACDGPCKVYYAAAFEPHKVYDAACAAAFAKIYNKDTPK